MTRRISSRTAASVAVLLGLASGPIVGSFATAHAATTGATTFTFTGHEQPYTVPAGVTNVRIVAVGAPGAADVSGSVGGAGATTTADIPVTAGQVLYAEVGGSGSTDWNGGGAPGGISANPEDGSPGGAGGDATDVRTNSVTGSGSLATRVVVAGGGGGGGGVSSDAGVLGMNGGAAGSAGFPLGTECAGPFNTASDQGCAGAAGTSKAGGAGGAGSQHTGTAGELGTGGAGGQGQTGGGGGGGGGLYGGGGGGGQSDDGGNGGGGGGGGSSGFGAGATHTSVAVDSTDPPMVTITPLFSFTVTRIGTGSGKVTGSGISCGKTCGPDTVAAGTVFTLTATASAGSRFTGWSGDCKGTKTCKVTITTRSAVVHAAFAKAPPNTKVTGSAVESTHAVFRFKATGASTRFSCALARNRAKPKFATCKSPKKFTGLKKGHYEFLVRAVGPGGTDKTPATRRFTVTR
jgi:hypothetical protein